MLRTLIKKALKSSKSGKKLLNFLRLKKSAFHPASGEPFSYLDTRFGKKTIDKVYSEIFNKLFVLVRSLPLKGDIFEFGVYQGYTSLLFAKNMKKFELNDTSLHLFDSFVGLPDEQGLDKNSYEFLSGVWLKGSMNVAEGLDGYIHKKLGKILSPDRVHVVKGFFEATLESYFKDKKIKAKIVHVDCDLYSSSKYVLDLLFKNEIIQDGTVIIFDDWMTSLGNPNLGQRKATSEILEKYPHWSIEKYLNYGIGSHVFIAHDLRITNENCHSFEKGSKKSAGIKKIT